MTLTGFEHSKETQNKVKKIKDHKDKIKMHEATSASHRKSSLKVGGSYGRNQDINLDDDSEEEQSQKDDGVDDMKFNEEINDPVDV